MIGIDEVGRGSWAGPLLVVAARKRATLPKGLDDSKRLSRLSRERLAVVIAPSCDIGEGWVEAIEIDALGLSAALTLASNRALSIINALPGESIILDGSHNYLLETFKRTSCRIKADQTEPLVSAASIWAKVRRDAYMAQLDTIYDGFGFALHVGYGTAAHQIALQKQGPIIGVHRFSFAPIKKIVSERSK